MDPRLSLIVQTVRDDTGSGAAEIFRRVLESFSEVLERPSDLDASDLREFCIQLHLAKRSMAPLFNFANHILLSLESSDWIMGLLETLMSMRNEIDQSKVRLGEVMRDEIGGRRIMTISYSSTILAGLATLERKPEVIIPISLPMGEGRQMARALVERGIKAEIIQDSMVFSVMEEMDQVLVGADALVPRGIVNKVGTFPMLAAAERFEVPAFVVCDWMKVSPVDMIDPIETQTQVGKDLSMREQLFELTPMELLTAIITDRGVLTSEEMRERMLEMPMSHEWASLF